MLTWMRAAVLAVLAGSGTLGLAGVATGIAAPASAGPVSLLGDSWLGAPQGDAFIPGLGTASPRPQSASLVTQGDAQAALIALGANAWAVAPGALGPGPLPPGRQAARLRDLIARAEAGPADYDAVQHGARIRPPGRPTRLSIDEIYRWIDDTPGQPHAIGRYQFIPPTLRRLVRTAGIDPSERFSPAVQDRLADLLLAEAGFEPFLEGDLPRLRFKRNLARIWAGLPLPDGRSYYHGHAGNKATMSWQEFETAILAIFPQR